MNENYGKGVPFPNEKRKIICTNITMYIDSFYQRLKILVDLIDFYD